MTADVDRILNFIAGVGEFEEDDREKRAYFAATFKSGPPSSAVQKAREEIREYVIDMGGEDPGHELWAVEVSDPPMQQVISVDHEAITAEVALAALRHGLFTLNVGVLSALNKSGFDAHWFDAIKQAVHREGGTPRLSIKRRK